MITGAQHDERMALRDHFRDVLIEAAQQHWTLVLRRTRHHRHEELAMPRTKWCTTDLPDNQRRTHRSETATYRWLQGQAEAHAGGQVLDPHVYVYVDERDGQGWQRYEHVYLPDLLSSEVAP